MKHECGLILAHKTQWMIPTQICLFSSKRLVPYAFPNESNSQKVNCSAS